MPYSEVNLSQLTAEQLIHLQRNIRKECERRRQDRIRGRFLQGDSLKTVAELVNMEQTQLEHLQREAYPRRHCATVEEAFENADKRLTAGIGEWKYDPETLTITHEDYPNYEICLTDLTTAAKLLDHLLQITTKGFWVYDSFGELIGLLKMVCQEEFQKSLQGVFCPNGESRVVQWHRIK